MKKVTITENGIEKIQFYTDKEFKVLVNGVEFGAKEEPKKEKYIPKVGDCVRARCFKFVFMGFDNAGNLIAPTHYIDMDIEPTRRVIKNVIPEYGINPYNDLTQITPEELQAEFEKCGYHYDFESGKAVKLRWKPNTGDDY